MDCGHPATGVWLSSSDVVEIAMADNASAIWPPSIYRIEPNHHLRRRAIASIVVAMHQFLARQIATAFFFKCFRIQPSSVRNWCQHGIGFFTVIFLTVSGLAAPVIDPIANVNLPAGKSLILPITDR